MADSIPAEAVSVVEVDGQAEDSAAEVVEAVVGERAEDGKPEDERKKFFLE